MTGSLKDSKIKTICRNDLKPLARVMHHVTYYSQLGPQQGQISIDLLHDEGNPSHRREGHSGGD